MMSFVHLHLHSQYSLLDGFCPMDPLMEECKSLGMSSVALTDHGNMFGAIEFYKSAKRHGIKPILGSEVYVCSDIQVKDRKRYHLVLLAKNDQGYHHLMKIVSEAYVDGFYYKPRVDKEVLRKYRGGLIALSACLQGEVARACLDDGYERARELALEYEDIFGKGNFFLEIQDHGLREEKEVIHCFHKLHEELGIELVATNDVHYIKREDAKAHDLLLCIQTGKVLQEEDRMRFPSDDFYLKSSKEMEEIFAAFPSAIENTEKIAKACNVELEFHKLHLPHFQVPTKESHELYLRSLVYQGLDRKYKDTARYDEAKERADYELSVIESMGYVDYFLIVQDFVQYAKSQDIPVGPGRGSAAGSLVSYLLSITNIDPLEYHLLFERFLNPNRVSMPDIDIDFDYVRRDEVIDYVKQKYGKEKVAQIVTFGTMQSKNAIRDVGRAMDVPLYLVDKIAKAVPNNPKKTLKDFIQEDQDFRALYEENKELIDYAIALEGAPRHTSTHAAGVLIASKPVDDLVPLARNGDLITTQFDMNELEELGLLKMDFLGLRNLTVIKDAVEMVESNYGINLDMDAIDFSDPKILKLFYFAKTIGIFQFESTGMRAFLKELKPDRFDDLVAANALFRPGPMDNIPTYVHNRHHPEDVRYLHPLLEPILKTTYGVIVYQEQVMLITQNLAGYTMAEADNLRRAMSKKKRKIMEENRERFLAGCRQKEISKEIANEIYDQMISFAEYAFNKSHSVAYAYIAMQTAYLKVYYPKEYFAALLTSIASDTTKIALYLREAEDMGIKILKPDINRSDYAFKVEGDGVRYGLSAVKNVGYPMVEAARRAIALGGEFSNLENFLHRLLDQDKNCINKRAIESLIKAGALDVFGLHRSQLMLDLELSITSVQNAKRNNVVGQTSLFDQLDPILEEKKEQIAEYKKPQFLAYEKEVLGIYLSDHPFSSYEKLAKDYVDFSMEHLLLEEDLSPLDRRRVKMAGILADKRELLTKKQEKMAFIQIEDHFGLMEVVVFPSVFQECSPILTMDRPLFVSGHFKLSGEDDLQLIAESIQDLRKLPKRNERLYLKLDSRNRPLYLKLRNLLLAHSGKVPVVLYFSDKKKSVLMNASFYVTLSKSLEGSLVDLLGRENVVIS